MEPRETQPAVRKIETGAVVEPGYIILMAGEAHRRGAGHVRQLVILGNGAAWNLATRHFPEATQIVDLHHAREHVRELARLLEFMLGDHKQDWLDERLAELDAGDIPAICAAAGAFPLAGSKASDLSKALAYFRNDLPLHRSPLADGSRPGPPACG